MNPEPSCPYTTLKPKGALLVGKEVEVNGAGIGTTLLAWSDMSKRRSKETFIVIKISFPTVRSTYFGQSIHKSETCCLKFCYVTDDRPSTFALAVDHVHYIVTLRSEEGAVIENVGLQEFFDGGVSVFLE